jgi:GTPase SAR1 family protein
METNKNSVNEKHDYMVKILIIGDSAVGKTCILLRYAKDKFTDSHLTTIGIKHIK